MELGRILNGEEKEEEVELKNKMIESSESEETNEDMDQDYYSHLQSEKNAERRITRSLRKKLSSPEQLPGVSQQNVPSKLSIEPRKARLAASTCYPVNKLPSLCKKVLASLPPEKQKLVDIYELQNLTVEFALDVERFGAKASSKVLREAMVERIMEDRKELNSSTISHIRQSKAVTFWHDQKHVASVIERYKEQMASEEMERERSYLNIKFAWTNEDIEKFKEAYELYGDGPSSNKLIATHIGNGVHPNHVSHFKKKWKRKQKQKEKINPNCK